MALNGLFGRYLVSMAGRCVSSPAPQVGPSSHDRWKDRPVWHRAGTTEHPREQRERPAIEPIRMRVPDTCRYLGIGLSTLYVLNRVVRSRTAFKCLLDLRTVGVQGLRRSAFGVGSCQSCLGNRTGKTEH